FHQLEKAIYQPGEQAKIWVGSATQAEQLLFEVEEDQAIVQRTWVPLSGLQALTMDIQEKHWGNVHYHLTFVKENRVYLQSSTISVPWKQKELQIEYATFRDRLYPGQEEEWRIKISGAQKEKVAAEMLVAMYDASLDALAPHQWGFDVFPYSYPHRAFRSSNFQMVSGRLVANQWQPRFQMNYRQYPVLNWFGFPFYNAGRPSFGFSTLRVEESMVSGAAPRAKSRERMANAAPPSMDATEDVQLFDSVDANAMETNEPENDPTTKEVETSGSDLSDVKVRTNLKETVFFFPNLQTDEAGNVIIKFTMNEALTRWKFLGFAHTQDLKSALTEKSVVTQKDLMVLPNPPRFVREGDRIEYTAKVSNLTEQSMSGQATLALFDALTMQPVDILLGNRKASIDFIAEAGQSARLSWELTIPQGQVMALTHRVIAQAGNFSDGEESTIPVLTNRMLVTETQPLPLKGKERKTFRFGAMEKANTSNTLQHHQLSLEFTSNPAWYAVQALPYLMDYPHQCTEQIFSRFYANSLASSVANQHPKIKRVFDQWKNTEALESNLSKNEELKTALLTETPWVLTAQSEAQQKRNIGLLFDLNRMGYEQEQALATIAERQLSNGGFPWFPGGEDNRFMTQYLVEGFGHLDRLGVREIKTGGTMAPLLQKAVQYIDQRMVEEYDRLAELVAAGKAKWEDNHLSSLAIHYLYARSFFNDIPFEGSTKKVRNYYLGQAEQYWLKNGIYQEGLLALALYRADQKDVAQKITKSLKERSLEHEELGRYWKYPAGYLWYQLPIETQALMIEVFSEVAQDPEMVDALKIWLLKNKQTNHWKTTTATASAVYALLMNGENWLLSEGMVSIDFPTASTTNWTTDLRNAQRSAEAGSGYFKSTLQGAEVTNDLSTIQIDNPNEHPAWGALYWQYFEDLDKIKTFEDTPLKLTKSLFREQASDRGPVMEPVTGNTVLEPGDKIKVRIELRVDRPMEYVHMKDMRASGLEPLNVLSRYQWQGGLGYYESTRDASTHFFFDYLPSGTFVFEYPLRVNHKGDFSNGITSIQCMYAPEFTSHSEGARIEIK
ncbi:MAG: alpha-2-macroglobulin family protein, partial [Bacteroidota bacterium]